MKEKVRYISVKTVQKTERVTEYVVVEKYKIRYRDKNNKIVKFDTRKKLRVEVQFIMNRGTVVPKKWSINSKSYGLPLRRRKRPVSDKIIQSQFARKHALKIQRGHMIVSQVDEHYNLYSWTYYYQSKTKVQKALERKKNREKKQRQQKKLVTQFKKKFIKKGSTHGYKKSIKN